jgi:hypothetical protein
MLIDVSTNTGTESDRPSDVDVKALRFQLSREAAHGAEDKVKPLDVSARAELRLALDEQHACVARVGASERSDASVQLIAEYPDRTHMPSKIGGFVSSSA